MRHRGRITRWKDDKGFGFITPNGGGPDVFVHITSFSNRHRRPADNAPVTYRLSVDARGRTRGIDVVLAGGRPHRVSDSHSVVVALTVAGLFLALVLASVLTGHAPAPALGLYLGASLAAFLVYGADKSAARRNRWRARETTLHLLGLAGGWPGAFVAQRVFRHKSSKRSFQTAFWTTVVVNCVGFTWMLSASGAP